MSRIQDLTQSYHSATIQYLSVLQICCARLIRRRRSGTVGLTLRSLFTENRRSDKRIFQFISWLRVGEAEEVPLAEAVRVARREFPRPAGQHPDVCLRRCEFGPGCGWWAPAARWPRAPSCEWPRRTRRASRWMAGSSSPTPSCCATRGSATPSPTQAARG